MAAPNVNHAGIIELNRNGNAGTTTGMKRFGLFSQPIKLVKHVPPGLWLIILMAAYVWRLTLFGNRTLIHGDSLAFGLPLFELRNRVVFGHASALWQNTIYGGHPLFAEGQGAFASPVTMILAALVTPFAGAVYTANLF